MEKYIQIGIIALTAFWILTLVCKIMLDEIRQRIHYRWQKKQEWKEAMAEQRAKEKAAAKHSVVRHGNQIIERILMSYNIIIFGALGAGKSLLANMLIFYLNEKYKRLDKRGRRFNKYMKPGYVADLAKLEENKKLRVYSNIVLRDSEGRTEQDIWPFLFQEKPFVENGIIFVDEQGEIMGKDLYYRQVREQDARWEWAANTARYGRQIRNLKWIATEHDADNIWKPIRDKGFLGIHALRTYVTISTWGKFTRTMQSITSAILPALLTVNLIAEYRKAFRLTDKLLLSLKLLLPAYFTLPFVYYRNRIAKNQSTKANHTQFRVFYNYNGFEGFFKFGTNQIFKYNTRGAEIEYNKRFNQEGGAT